MQLGNFHLGISRIRKLNGLSDLSAKIHFIYTPLSNFQKDQALWKVSHISSIHAYCRLHRFNPEIIQKSRHFPMFHRIYPKMKLPSNENSNDIIYNILFGNLLFLYALFASSSWRIFWIGTLGIMDRIKKDYARGWKLYSWITRLE